MKRASLTRLSPFSLGVFTLAPDLSFEYGPSLAFAKNTTVLQSSTRCDCVQLRGTFKQYSPSLEVYSITQMRKQRTRVFNTSSTRKNLPAPCYKAYRNYAQELTICMHGQNFTQSCVAKSTTGFKRGKTQASQVATELMSCAFAFNLLKHTGRFLNQFKF